MDDQRKGSMMDFVQLFPKIWHFLCSILCTFLLLSLMIISSLTETGSHSSHCVCWRWVQEAVWEIHSPLFHQGNAKLPVKNKNTENLVCTNKNKISFPVITFNNLNFLCLYSKTVPSMLQRKSWKTGGRFDGSWCTTTSAQLNTPWLVDLKNTLRNNFSLFSDEASWNQRDMYFFLLQCWDLIGTKWEYIIALTLSFIPDVLLWRLITFKDGFQHWLIYKCWKDCTCIAHF